MKSVCGLIPVPGGCRAKKTSTEGEDASLRISVVFGNNVVFVSSHVHLSCKTRVLQFGPYATASASAALLQIELPRLSKSGLFSALVSSSRIVSYSFSNVSSHANLPSWTSCQGSARRPYMKDSLPAALSSDGLSCTLAQTPITPGSGRRESRTCRTRRTKRPRWSALGRLPHRDPVHSGVLLPVSPNDNGVGAHLFCVQRVAVHRRRGLKTTRGSRRQSREASRSCRMSRMARQQTKSKDKMRLR